ncbi:predicted protein [Lichtheimia corymbifera JMRC:FSU:9682]|uniref:Uncharacterized protein n=1 Tax=Lichtheimia corymbifera JMRC:FSU:9682 TaxID=1263082 RepID=A0A068S421_9FUNG|nr:predicted protein [Lichtheimia corymbifera JMRC:FSU:9682]
MPKLSTTSLYTASFGLNMLDDGTCGKQQDVDLKARTLYGWLNAAAHTGSDGYKVISRIKKWYCGYLKSLSLSATLLLSQQHFKDAIVLYSPWETINNAAQRKQCDSLVSPQGFKHASSVRTAPSLRLLISLPLERKMDISIEQHVVGSTAGFCLSAVFYPATHACYRWVISTTITKQQAATKPISLVTTTLTRFPGGSRHGPIANKSIQQRTSLTGMSHQQQPTMLHVFLVLLSRFTHRSKHLSPSVSPFRLRNDDQNFIVWTSLQQGIWFWLLGGNRHCGFSYDSGCQWRVLLL